MRRMAVLLAPGLLTIALMATLLVGVAAPAGAHDGNSAGCVDRHEFGHVSKGWLAGRVHRVFDANGKFANGFAGGFTRVYDPCWGKHWLRAAVSYDGWTTRALEKRILTDGEPWVTRYEYNRVNRKSDPSKRRAHQIFDTSGRVAPTFHGDAFRNYPAKFGGTKGCFQIGWGYPWLGYNGKTKFMAKGTRLYRQYGCSGLW